MHGLTLHHVPDFMLSLPLRSPMGELYKPSNPHLHVLSPISCCSTFILLPVKFTHGGCRQIKGTVCISYLGFSEPPLSELPVLADDSPGGTGVPRRNRCCAQGSKRLFEQSKWPQVPTFIERLQSQSLAELLPNPHALLAHERHFSLLSFF